MALTTYTVTTSGYSIGYGNGSMVKDLSGVLHYVYRNDTTKKLYHTYSNNNGYTWSYPVEVASSTYGFNQIACVVDNTNNVWAFSDYSNGSTNIAVSYKKTPANVWSASDSQTNHMGSQAAVNNLGEIMWVAKTINAGTGTDSWKWNGSAWSSAGNLANSSASLYSVTAAGSAFHFVTGSGALKHSIYTSSWSTLTQIVASDGSSDIQVGLCSDGTNVYLVYTDTSNLRFNRYNGSAWLATYETIDNSGTKTGCSITVGQNNQLYVIYKSSSNNNVYLKSRDKTDSTPWGSASSLFNNGTDNTRIAMITPQVYPGKTGMPISGFMFYDEDSGTVKIRNNDAIFVTDTPAQFLIDLF